MDIDSEPEITIEFFIETLGCDPDVAWGYLENRKFADFLMLSRERMDTLVGYTLLQEKYEFNTVEYSQLLRFGYPRQGVIQRILP